MNNGLFELLNSHDTPPEHTVFREPPQEKIWYSEFRWPRRPSDVAETTNTGSTLLHVPTLHCDWPYEMASSPLPFLFPPTKTSYRSSAIFKFEMCQSAPRHPVLNGINSLDRWRCCCDVVQARIAVYVIFIYIFLFVHWIAEQRLMWNGSDSFLVSFRTFSAAWFM